MGSVIEEESKCAKLIKILLDGRIGEDPFVEKTKKKKLEERPTVVRKFRINSSGQLEIHMVGQKGVSSWFKPQELNMFPANMLRILVKTIEVDAFTEEKFAAIGVVKIMIEEKS